MTPEPGVTPTNCPRCGHLLDAATFIKDKAVRPTPGDFSLCVYCGELLRFDHELEPVLTTSADLRDFSIADFLALEVERAALRTAWRRHREEVRRG